MPQPTNRLNTSAKPKRSAKRKIEKGEQRLPQKTRHGKTQRPHKQEYGTSKLEEKFAKEFLDRLDIKYQYQFKAESIGRYFDFYIPSANLIIEVDGDYWHSYNTEYEKMTPTQKKNKRVDEQKNLWAVSHGIPVLRIWEHDIRTNPTMVLNMLKEHVAHGVEKVKLLEEKKKRH